MATIKLSNSVLLDSSSVKVYPRPADVKMSGNLTGAYVPTWDCFVKINTTVEGGKSMIITADGQQVLAVAPTYNMTYIAMFPVRAETTINRAGTFTNTIAITCYGLK